MHRSIRISQSLAAFAALILFVYLIPAGCSNKTGSDNPDLVVFATGSLFGQLHTCG
jgi:hypothetical protein